MTAAPADPADPADPAPAATPALVSPATPVLRLVVLCPHFAPDTAPTGHVMTRIVTELAARGHELHVVTALPWYREHRVEPEWGAPRPGHRRSDRWMRTEATAWGSITRLHPFPGGDRRDLVRRAAGFAGFSLLAALGGLRAGGWLRRADAVIAMSPPLTLGLTGWFVGVLRRAPLVFNVQDVFPDAAVETGAITDRRIIAVASWLERLTYRRAGAITVLSDDLAGNVRAKIPERHRDAVHVIPNFVLTDELRPADRSTAYRRELGIGDEPVVLYAGNVGFSQSLDLVLHAARELPGATFLINGQGAARADLEAAARDLPNVRFGDYQPAERLAEVLATGDVHVVPLRPGLGRVSMPSKTYSILAAGRPVVAAIDPDTEVPRMLVSSGAGTAVPPDDPAAFVGALREMLDRPDLGAELGTAGRRWVETAASPAAVAAAYEALVVDRRARRRGRRRGLFARGRR